MDFFNDLISERLGGKGFGVQDEIFKFEKIKRAKAEAKKNHSDMKLIDMGVGEPDQAADIAIVEILSKEARKLENRYYADNGISDFQVAAVDYLKKVYHVEGLDPQKNIIHGMGSKSILAMMPLCVINPGDVALVTAPGYPILGTCTKYLGGEVYHLPICEENDFLPDLENIPIDILKRAKILYINYPNNPTGAVASKAFFEGVVRFAKENHILVVHDAAYAAITFDGYQPLSFLSIPGAIDVGVEIHSLSKAYNMTGWRIAFVAGHEKIIKAYGAIKDNIDSGQFIAIQKAGVYALKHIEITSNSCEKYSRRMNLLVDALKAVGFEAKKPKGTFYCYVKSPKGAGRTLFENAEQAADYLIRNALVSTVPWDNVGSYLRFSVTFEAERCEEETVINELKMRLDGLKLVF